MVSAFKRLGDSKGAWVLSSVPADWLIDSLPQSLVSVSGGDEPNTIHLLSVTVTECPRLLHHRRKGPVCLHCRIIGSPLALWLRPVAVGHYGGSHGGRVTYLTVARKLREKEEGTGSW